MQSLDTVLLNGDALTQLRTLHSASIQCCVTSPPYFGLRDYGHAGQIGLEDTPDAYVANLVAVFREVRRVLKDDGTVWLNLGDSYNNFRVSQRGQSLHALEQRDKPTGRRPVDPGLKEKDLIGIPWRVAFALQADGWYLRQDIIWHKPNPMPESVTDRCTKAHEYLFLLTKSARYYYDAEAVNEPASDPYRPAQGGYARMSSGDPYADQNAGEWGVKGRRNRRSVWTVTTKPYKGAHFAVMPEALVKPCVLAGSRPGDTILDPFTGSGTVGVVARRCGRSFTGIELNPEYLPLIKQRLKDAALPMFD